MEKLTSRNCKRLKSAEKRLKEWTIWAVVTSCLLLSLSFFSPFYLFLLSILFVLLPGIIVLAHILWAKRLTEYRKLEPDLGWRYFTKIHKKAITLLWISLSGFVFVSIWIILGI